jgi:hypothetical protein
MNGRFFGEKRERQTGENKILEMWPRIVVLSFCLSAVSAFGYSILAPGCFRLTGLACEPGSALRPTGSDADGAAPHE